MALIISGCNDADSGSGGETALNIKNQQVWQFDAEGVLVAYDGTIPLLNNAGGTGSIANGILNFIAEKPPQTSLVPMGTFLTTIDDKFKIFSYADWGSTSPNAMELRFTSINLTKAYYYSSSDTSTIEESIRNIYVDRACTLIAPSQPSTSVTGVSGPVNVAALNLSLKEGWNKIKTRMEISPTGNTASITIGDSDNCLWIYQP
jgi:hypothetical protein